MNRGGEWDQVVVKLRYLSSRDMLKDLYQDQGYSLADLEQLLGFTSVSIRRRIVLEGLRLRSRGGPNRKGKSSVSPDKVTDEELLHVLKTADERKMSPNTLWKEKARRKKEKEEKDERERREGTGQESKPKSRRYNPIQR